MKTLGWLLILMLAFTSISCAKKKQPDPKLWEIQPPTARVVALTLTDQTDTGFRVEAVVELTNDNRVALPLVNTHYEITVGNAGTLSLVEASNKTIPAHGKQLLTLPASFAWDGPAPAGAPWVVKGRVSYHPPGELRQIMTETKIPLPRLEFHSQGSLN